MAARVWIDTVRRPPHLSCVEHFSTHTTIGAAAVQVSQLAAGGFHPVLRDYHQCSVNPLHILAYDGVKIDLPAHEVEDAVAYVRACRDAVAPPGDAIPPRTGRDAVRGLLGLGLAFPAFLFLPFALVLGLSRGAAALSGYGVGVLIIAVLCGFAWHARRRVEALRAGGLVEGAPRP